MSVPATFSLEAEREYIEAIAWYESQRPGLGREFNEMLLQALERAQTNPGFFRIVRRTVRKIRIQRFRAYSIYFTIDSTSCYIIAVFHASRDPAALNRRLG